MKISEITCADVAEYLRRTDEPLDEWLLNAVMQAAKQYIVGYTGIPPDELDAYEDISIAFMVLCQDMYDNRTLVAENTGVNRVVDTILGMHSRNLIGGASNACESGRTE